MSAIQKRALQVLLIASAVVGAVTGCSPQTKTPAAIRQLADICHKHKLHAIVDMSGGVRCSLFRLNAHPSWTAEELRDMDELELSRRASK